MRVAMRRVFRGGAAALAAAALAAACGGGSDAPAPSIVTRYAPPDAGMIAWVDAEQAAAYLGESLDILPESLIGAFPLDEALGALTEESGFDVAGLSEVMAFANADLDGGAVVLDGVTVDDFLQRVRDLLGDAELEEKSHRGAAMIETPTDSDGGALAAAAVRDGDGPELHIIGTANEVRAAIDRQADAREGNGDADGPALEALRALGDGWTRFAMAVPDGAFGDLTDALPDEYGGLFAGVDAGVLSGLTLAGFAANREDGGAERWTLRLEYADDDGAERAASLAEGAIAVSKALTPEGASLDVLDAAEVSRDGTAVTVVSSATAEQAEALRAEQAEALRNQIDSLGMAL